MSDDQFDKLYQTIQGISLTNAAAIADLEKQMNMRFDEIMRILDKQSALLDVDETERMALSKQVDRHEDWVERAADKVGVRYAHSN